MEVLYCNLSAYMLFVCTPAALVQWPYPRNKFLWKWYTRLVRCIRLVARVTTEKIRMRFRSREPCGIVCYSTFQLVSTLQSRGHLLTDI